MTQEEIQNFIDREIRNAARTGDIASAIERITHMTIGEKNIAFDEGYKSGLEDESEE